MLIQLAMFVHLVEDYGYLIRSNKPIFVDGPYIAENLLTLRSNVIITDKN